MSAFSRGLSGFLHQNCLRLPSSIRATLLSSRIPNASYTGRSAFSTSFRQYAKVSSRAHRPGSTSARFPASNPILRLVESTGKPVLLYKAPERGLMTLATYSAAALCTFGGVWTFNNMYLQLPKEQPRWVGVAYGFIALTLMGLGLYVFSAPVSRLRSIQVIPDLTSRRSLLRFEGKIAPVPFLKPQVKTVKVGEAYMSEKIRPVVEVFRDVSLIKTQDITYGLKNRWAITRPFIITLRYLSRGLLRWFVNTRIAFTRYGIVTVVVDGEKWKIDASGWLLDDGKGLDSVIPTH